jgi:hypothetical protein
MDADEEFPAFVSALICVISGQPRLRLRLAALQCYSRKLSILGKVFPLCFFLLLFESFGCGLPRCVFAALSRFGIGLEISFLSVKSVKSVVQLLWVATPPRRVIRGSIPSQVPDITSLTCAIKIVSFYLTYPLTLWS